MMVKPIYMLFKEKIVKFHKTLDSSGVTLYSAMSEK
jgi:hypothetical protein